MPVSSRLARNRPSMRPTVGKFWTPQNPRFLSWVRNEGMERKGSVAQTPARTPVSLTMGMISDACGLVSWLVIWGLD
jgi:hypothetical protein